ncbi:MAG: phosphoribosylformylglycinamidine synthase [Deltaproteobacteria bacterium]|nr:phosphoribosylformylglycinamidine synthase [Candidatus Anaeroferrophillacea bacterium]
MPHRLEIFYRDSGLDTRGGALAGRLGCLGAAAGLEAVYLSEVYTLEADYARAELEAVAALLANPVVHDCLIDEPRRLPVFAWAVEVGFLPGVTDNVAHTAAETIADAWNRPATPEGGVYSSRVYYLAGRLDETAARTLAGQLANPLIQRITVLSAAAYAAAGGLPTVIPRVRLDAGPMVTGVDLELSPAELAALGREGVLDHLDDAGRPVRRGPLALELDCLRAIAAYFREIEGRNPTDVELESIAQTWSEHCKHTIFAAAIGDVADGLYHRYIKGATREIRRRRGAGDICVSVFVDNAGAIVFDDDYLITDKVETHNSPSALDPFGGAITGIVGVNRDAMGFGLGAKPVLNRYGFCFADPRDDEPLFRSPGRENRTLSPRQIMDGVIEGVRVGGNCSGIPTTQGFMYFHPRFKGKPLVFVGTLGFIPRETAGRPSHEKAAMPGDLVVMTGGRVGLDGIHGATFSSEALTAGSPATAVQIGDPITQKKMSDCLVKEARDRCLYRSITDNGAGGLSCSVAEMARECGGCEVELDRVPTKYPGMAPWQIWISESQERMTLAVPPEKWDELRDLLASRGVEATAIGRFTAAGRCRVLWEGRPVMDMELDFLHHGLPARHLLIREPAAAPPPVELDPTMPPVDLLPALLGRLNLASQAFVSTQYDYEVQGGTVVKPLAGHNGIDNFATVIRPRLDSARGVAVTQALYPTYTELDPYAMAAATIDTAVRRLLAAGCPLEHIALLDNFCWCSSTDPERLWQLKECARACYDTAVAFGAPFISGKDSMFNDFSGFDADGRPVRISVPPTLLISGLGVVPDVVRVRPPGFQREEDEIFLCGPPAAEELGGAEGFELLKERCLGRGAGTVPRVDSARLLPFYRRMETLLADGRLRSILPLATGGLAAALGLAVMADGCGARVCLTGKVAPGIELLTETMGRFLVSVAPAEAAAVMAEIGSEFAVRLGMVTGDARLAVESAAGDIVADHAVVELLAAYRATFAGY